MEIKGRAVGVFSALLALVLVCQPGQAQETPRMGGVLKAAMIGEPPSLDLHWTTAVITQQITWHVYETLFTYDRSFAPIPMLAESHTVADGGRRYTIVLRKGVKFHNGKEMTATDVVASLNRWGKISTPGKALWKSVEAVEAKDPSTVVIHLKEPSGSLLFGLGRPKEAGYAGQPIRWITTKEYEWMYKSALVAKQQLEEAGFKIDLQVLDWATLVQRRNKPELFDVFSTGYTFTADPALATSLQCSWPGWWCQDEKDRLLAELARERAQEAKGADRSTPDDLLRGRGAHQARRLLRARRRPQGREGVPIHPGAVLLERLAGPVSRVTLSLGPRDGTGLSWCWVWLERT